MAVDRRIAQRAERQRKLIELGFKPALLGHDFTKNPPIRQQSSPGIGRVPNPMSGLDFRKLIHNNTQTSRILLGRNDLESRKIIARGGSWYEEQHEILSKASQGNTSTIAGITSALSPKTNWDNNLYHAIKFYKTGVPDKSLGQYQANWDKAIRIRDGERPEDVLPMDLKTGKFYQTLDNPSDPTDPIPVDSHAFFNTLGHTPYVKNKKGLLVRADAKLQIVGGYNTFADAIRMAHNRVSPDLGYKHPQQLQALNWIASRNLIPEGYFDNE